MRADNTTRLEHVRKSLGNARDIVVAERHQRRHVLRANSPAPHAIASMRTYQRTR